MEKKTISGVNSLSRHEEASTCGGSFARQGGIITKTNLDICVDIYPPVTWMNKPK